MSNREEELQNLMINAENFEHDDNIRLSRRLFKTIYEYVDRSNVAEEIDAILIVERIAIGLDRIGL